MSLNITDHSSNRLTDADPLLQKCRTAVARRLSRTEEKVPLFIDPLTPLPLADAAVGGPAVRFVYFIMASRSYAHETINRNVRVLQRPGALEAYGSNESNLFLLHVDAKMSPSDQLLLRSRVIARPDVYYLRRTRAVMWAGYSMVLALVDGMGSLVARGLGFDTLINLSDADLTLRVDTEVRGFFARYPGRSIMSIVQRHRDPRRYKLHENFRNYCWFECEHGSAWVVAHPHGEALDGMKVIGKRKCCWSRSAPIVYTKQKLECANGNLPEVFHGSQWVSLHRSLVHHIVQHPTSQRILSSFEQTLLPDEAVLQTIAVNSPFRPTLIASHMRFIEWPQLHGDANKYWASLGPQFHGGPMVLNETLAAHKAFLTSAMFARKVDPTIYSDVLGVWDTWIAQKMTSQGVGYRQPPIGQSLTHADPLLRANVPPATPFETDHRLVGPEHSNPALGADANSSETRLTGLARPQSRQAEHAEHAAPVMSMSTPSTVMPAISSNRSATGRGQLAPSVALAAHAHERHAEGVHTEGVAADHDHSHGHDDEHDDHDHDHEHEGQTGLAAAVLFLWVAGLIVAASLMAGRFILRDCELGARLGALRARLRGPKPEGLKAF